MDIGSLKGSRMVGIALTVMAIYVLFVGLQELQVVLIPLVLAVLLSFIFQPTVLFLKSKRFPTWLALVAVVLVASAVLGLVVWVVYSNIQVVVGDFSNIAERFESQIRPIINQIEGSLSGVAATLNIPLERGLMRQLLDSLLEAQAVSTVVADVVSIAGTTALVLLFMMFILAGAGQLEQKVSKAFPPETARQIVAAMNNISSQVRQYLVAKTIVSAGTGLLLFAVLRITGVEYAVFWGFLAFVLNFVPNIGSVVAVILPSLWAFLQFSEPWTPFLAMGLMWLVQGVMGNVVDPKLMASSLNLSSLLVLISLLFWGWLWGIVGIVLAVPLTSTIKIICENIESLRPVAVLMGSAESGQRRKILRAVQVEAGAGPEAEPA
ncbi:MAG: AI-2E family transporter [Bacteroidota bacterium]|nr:AI-2E family transporter [Bacteroidota bacterium]